jgi:hypothetical protein
VTPAVRLGNKHPVTGALPHNNEDLTCTASGAWKLAISWLNLQINFRYKETIG